MQQLGLLCSQHPQRAFIVRFPVPGPISRAVSEVFSSEASMILSRIPGFRSKCCPNMEGLSALNQDSSKLQARTSLEAVVLTEVL